MGSKTTYLMTKAMRGQIDIYQGPEGTEIEVHFEGDTVWLSQRQMAELFEKDTDTIGLHLKHIFADSELDEQATTEDYSVVRKEGKRSVKRSIKHYNLDAIISVGTESIPKEVLSSESGLPNA